MLPKKQVVKVRWPTTVTAKQKVTAKQRKRVGHRLVSGCYLHLKWYVV